MRLGCDLRLGCVLGHLCGAGVRRESRGLPGLGIAVGAMKRPPSLVAILGGASTATLFAIAGTLAAALVLEAFALHLWPAIAIAFVCSWLGERLFPRR